MAAYTYPGVYIEELPSGQHTITGVATSIAAFIGWANQGPVGEAVMVQSWTEYQATFGGMIPGVYLGYAIYQFFLNGGSQAYIIRLVEAPSAIAGSVTSGTFTSGEEVIQNVSGASATLLGTVPASGPMSVGQITGTPDNSDLWVGQSSTATFTPSALPAANTSLFVSSSTIGGLVFSANSPGAWGNSIYVSITNVNATNNTFNLQVTRQSASGSFSTLENYTNLSTSPTDPQYAVTVINSDSNYIKLTATPSGVPPAITLPTSTIRGTIAGSVASGTFTSAEQVKQNVSGASATLIGTVPSAGPMLVGQITGTPDKADLWVGQSSTATFTPSALPVVTTSFALNGGTTATTGNDGAPLLPNTAGFEAQLDNTAGTIPPTGYQLLNSVPIFNLLCVPGETDAGIVANLQQFCSQCRAFLIVDSAQTAVLGTGSTGLSNTGPADSTGASLIDQYAGNSAFYFPWVSAPDPAAGFRPALFPPSGFVAGIYAATDASRGVWKAPAGIDASLTGALGLQYVLTDMQNGSLNPLGINCLRQFPNFGTVVWGARTIAGNDALGSQWKYVPIRRLALFIESSLYAGTQWAVFEPNAEPLWGQVRLSIGTFLQGLFLQGAFAGTTPPQAYFVKCDDENNTDATTAQGILNVTVGFAPLYPAEFVVIQIQQMMSNG